MPMKVKSILSRCAPYITWALALLAVFVLLPVLENHLLWKVQEMNLFLYSPLFFKQQMVVPGGLLTFLGTYFTQFFFQPWLGTALLCVWWALLAWLVKRTFRISHRWNVLALVPVALLLAADMEMGYWLYVEKLRGYFFVATLGTTAVTALLWAYRSLPARGWLRTLLLLLVVAVGYPLMGVYALAAALLMGVFSWSLHGTVGAKVLPTVVSLVAVVGVPLFYYHFVYYQTHISHIYWVELPLFFMGKAYRLYYIPYFLLAAFFLVMSLGYRRAEAKGKPMRGWLAAALNGLILLVLAGGVWAAWFKDENFHHELKMQHLIDRQDWVGVLHEAETQQCEPTRAVVMMRNLALSRIGKLGDLMYAYLPGSQKSNAPFEVYLMHVVGRLVYFNYGMLNECHRMCLEEGVEFGWRTEHLKYLTRCALLNGEDQAVRKYTGLLKQTRYYDRWAEMVEPLIGHPDLMEKAQSLGPVMHMMHYENALGADYGRVEEYLMRYLAQMDSDDPVFQEQTLAAAMWCRDPEAFWPRFVHYAQLHPHERIPIHYQEAAYLSARMLDRPEAEQIPFNLQVKQTFNAFMQKFSQCQNMPKRQAWALLYPEFGHTYFFDFYLMNDITYM